AIGVPLGAALVRLVLGAVLPLVPDETYYWEWSRRLAPAYFDHPPAVAVLVRAGTRLLGDTPLGVRLGPQLAGLVGILGCVLLAARLGGVRAAWRTAVLTAGLPLAWLGLVLATPDAPLLAGVSLTLVALERAVHAEPGSPASLRWWTLGGVCLGLALLSKYTAVLLPAGVLVALLTHRELRPQLAHAGPWVAAAVAVGVALPAILWNARHDWVSVAFQLRHGLGGGGAGSALRRELSYLGALLLLASPVLFVLLVSGAGRALRTRERREAYLLVVVATTWACFFAVSALRHRVEPNWAAPALAAAAPLVALGRVTRRGIWWLRVGAASGIALVVVGCACAALPAPLLRGPARRAIERSFGPWRPLAERVFAERGSLARGSGRAPWVAADRYQQASELAFLLPDHPHVFSLNLGGRPNQYDLWPTFPRRAALHDDLLLVLEDRPEALVVIGRLRPFFDGVERRAERGDGARRHQLWLLRSWRGGWPVTVK
ncbi:MAG TPA: glycosyltransferase family 39 protein, partial [Gemmatimonadaceae bacterium]|nr:glycosyltransferase family 39 protein [Gemmatimonadaceae bacterium]